MSFAWMVWRTRFQDRARNGLQKTRFRVAGEKGKSDVRTLMLVL